MLDFSRERMSDRANGILEFSVNHDFEDAHVFHFWERYSSNAMLGQHNTQPEVTKFMQDVSRDICHLRAQCPCTENWHRPGTRQAQRKDPELRFLLHLQCRRCSNIARNL